MVHITNHSTPADLFEYIDETSLIYIVRSMIVWAM